MTYIYSRIVRFQDTDAAGVVYFTNILAMCHEAYEASLTTAEIDIKNFFINPDSAIPVVHATVDFRFPLYCGDHILIESTPELINETSFKIQYKVVLKSSDQLIAQGSTKHICIDPKTRQRKHLPAEILNWLDLGKARFLMADLDTVVIWRDGNAYFFKGNQYINYNLAHHCIESGYPKKIQQGIGASFPESFHQGIDAGLLWNNGKAFLFKGNEYLRFDLYQNRVEPGYPQKLNSGNWLGWPSHFYQGIDAAVLWNNGKAYFFKGDEYIQYDIYKEMTDRGYPKKIKDGLGKEWPLKFTEGIDAAVTLNYQKAFLFKEDQYIVYDINLGSIEPGHPKKINETWSIFYCKPR
ncbi:1,4-dihydroxy-2-naphthoyl-CoA hydrolase [Planktothrix tepida]|uniref:1,4-dihydroxy-2-naphthoyl-CoA hydrolase n=2 Tax=Planktothrix TaxID=54304 RepID=A0A1J1LMC8_9CYAN|nr:hemopexin repeat-containing protein [Planktothrix tepida]CAD5946409.1 1,4-dihydroxy-2-naphthoyl-CoA hydrolase [Planktothrix tepida]CAD5964544.1 1,4-dihydroxy-2-naphthoyl-CoA hydrolase [Planktothrix pseudagardhii]CUR32769.1 Thioesterase superfamily protein [Planktothrix tepida PCC 9214]